MEELSKARESLSREYVYDARRYLFDVRIPALLAAVAVPVGVLMIVQNVLVPIAAGVIVISVYVLFNTFIAKCYPYRVTLDGDKLVFESFGRTDVVPFASIERLQVRENARSKNVYARINGGGLTHGRYFVACGDLYDRAGKQADDLFRFFLDTEARLHPDNLRVRARAVQQNQQDKPEQNATEKHATRSRRHCRNK